MTDEPQPLEAAYPAHPPTVNSDRPGGYQSLGQAIGDPGSVVARHQGESITAWSTRAVGVVLREQIDALPCGAHAVCVCRWHRDDKGLIRRSQVLALLGDADV